MSVDIRDGLLFFPPGGGGIMIGKKIVCMRKNAGINCGPEKICLQRPPMLCKILGI